MTNDLHYYAFQYRNAHSIDAAAEFKRLEEFVQKDKDERYDLLVRARNLLSQPAHWGADDEQIKSRYALYTEIQEHIAGVDKGAGK